MNILSDLRYTLQSASKRPGFVATVCGTLALGVASVTTMFAFVNSILLNPLPFPHSGDLVQICDLNRRENKTSPLVSIPDVIDFREKSTAFDGIAYYGAGTMALTGNGDPEPVQNIRVSDDFFSVIQVQPYIGRWFETNEFSFGPDRACIITYPLWKRRFNADPQVIGQTLALNGNSVTIVGVMPKRFSFPESADVALTSGFINWEKWHRDIRWGKTIGRLKPGVPLERAQAELSGIAEGLEQKYPNSNANLGIKVVPLREQIVGDTGKAMEILFGAVCCVLVIACANIASLLMVRAVERKKEFAIRIALGATRYQIAKQQITESLLLAVLGGVLSGFVSFWCVKALVGLSPAQIPRLDEVHISPTVLAFCLAISVFCGIMFGLAPILQTLKTKLVENLNEEGKAGSGSHRTNWARSLILLFPVMVTVVLMIGAGLFLRSYFRMQNVDIGFNPEHVVVSKIQLRPSQYAQDFDRTRLFKPLLAKLTELVQNKAVALAARPPFAPPFMLTMGVDGVPRAPGEKFTARFNSVSDDYFNTLGMRLVEGRNFSSTDSEKSPRVVIVNQCLAKKYIGSQDPIGKRITVWGNGTNLFTIVGIVNDVHQSSFAEDPEPELYLDFLQVNDITVYVVAKVEHSSDVKSFGSGMKKVLQAIDGRQAASNLEEFDTILARSLQVQKFRTYLLVCFASIALILSTVGIFGFLSYTVGQRTREIGILAALGAPRTHIVQLVMKETLLVISTGLVVGLLVAFVMSRLMETFLFQVAARDVFTFVSVAVFVGVAATVSAYIPVRKATRLEVVAALRA
jgi:putative ABC transport system permease protein